MLAATLTEGAHYLIDVIAGSAMAVFGLVLARPIIRLEDRLMQRRAEPARDFVPA
jgi:membrane-associated phospholipid phosphatase